MAKLPKVIASSVIRSAHQGQSHGGVYIVDLASDRTEQVIDWDDQSITWEGRGLDRGLRGIAFSNDRIYLAASDEIFIYDRDFNIVSSLRNRFLKHCHEIYIKDNLLLITSTGFDAVLVFDLDTQSFSKGYSVRLNKEKKKLYFSVFDPNADTGPLPGDTIHINNVFFGKQRLFFASLRLSHLFYLNNEKLYSYAIIPQGTHNARPYKDGVLINDTAHNRVACLDLNGRIIKSFPIISYPEEQLLMHELPVDHARQAFGRGLCVDGNGLIIGGSSPATISVYNTGCLTALKTVNLTMDIRNSIHGLEIWPF